MLVEHGVFERKRFTYLRFCYIANVRTVILPLYCIVLVPCCIFYCIQVAVRRTF